MGVTEDDDDNVSEELVSCRRRFDSLSLDPAAVNEIQSVTANSHAPHQKMKKKTTLLEAEEELAER